MDRSFGPTRYGPLTNTGRSLLAASLVEARTSLCDALDALGAHTEGLVVVGSHVVHERTKHLGIVSIVTKDCDLAVVPTLVADDPKIEEAMRGAGFRPLGEFDSPSHTNYLHQPGLWGRGIADDGSPVSEVDLIVPTGGEPYAEPAGEPDGALARSRWTRTTPSAALATSPSSPTGLWSDGQA